MQNYLSGLAIAISIISLILNLVLFWYDRRSKLKVNARIGYIQDKAILELTVTNLSRYRKFIKGFKQDFYSRFRFKRKIKLLDISIPLLIDNSDFESEESKIFYLEIGYITAEIECYKETLHDTDYLILSIVDSLDTRFKSNKISVSELRKIINDKAYILDNDLKEILNQMNSNLK